jgi:integrase/recombinase XerC/integrase/recombinase XerD
MKASSNRELVRVGGQIIQASTAASANDWRALVARFIAEEDIAVSSRQLYTRTLTQFFKYLERTGKLFAFYNKILDRTDILTYKDTLLAQGLSVLTVGSYIVVVRKFFAALEAQKIYPNIAKGIKTPKKDKGFKKMHLTDTESHDFLTLCKDNYSLRDYAIANLILRTGLRTIEVVRADIADITFKGGKRVLMVWGKGHDSKDNFVVLTDKAYLPIKEYLATERKGAKAGEPLFTSESIRNKGSRLTTRTISGICKDGLRGIGLDGKEYTAHSLRHTTACAILAHSNGDITAAQDVLRHASPVTTQIYVASIKDEMRIQKAPEALLDAAF